MRQTLSFAKDRAKALLMLALFLLQCMVVAVEGGASVGAFLAADAHHNTAYEPHHDAYHVEQSSDVMEQGVQPDSCDHCCHCHGHGTHMALTEKFLTAELLLRGDPICQNLFVVIAADFSTIYRPPTV